MKQNSTQGQENMELSNNVNNTHAGNIPCVSTTTENTSHTLRRLLQPAEKSDDQTGSSETHASDAGSTWAATSEPLEGDADTSFDLFQSSLSFDVTNVLCGNVPNIKDKTKCINENGPVPATNHNSTTTSSKRRLNLYRVQSQGKYLCSYQHLFGTVPVHNIKNYQSQNCWTKEAHILPLFRTAHTIISSWNVHTGSVIRAGSLPLWQK